MSHNYHKIRQYNFNEDQLAEMIEAEMKGLESKAPTDPDIFREEADKVLKKLGRKILSATTADTTKVDILWPEVAGGEGVFLVVTEMWKDKLPQYLDLLRA